MASIQGVYLALFGRPADPLGLAFFNQATSNGANLTAIGDLAATDEYQARFAGQSNTQIITSIYRSLFNRDPDLAGLTFFATALANKTLTINNIAIAIFDGAQGSDVTIRDLKVAAANSFTAAIDTVSEINGYSGTAAAQSGANFIASVTTTAPTADQVNAAVVAATTQPNIGGSLTLTVGADTLTGTGANESFGATVNSGVANATTLQAFDNINGGGGVDRLNVVLDTSYGGGATITNVEEIVATGNGTNFNAAGIAGLTLVGANGGAGATTFDGVGSVANVSARFSNQNLTVNYTDTAVAGAADKVIITAESVTGGTIALNSATANTVGVDSVEVVSTGSENTFAISSNDTSVTSVKASGAVALNLAVAGSVATSATTIDASAMTAATAISGLGVAAHTITLGSGNDVALFGANFTSADKVDGGAGTDFLGSAAAQLAAINTVLADVKNIEGLRITDDFGATATVINAANFGSISNVRIVDQGAGGAAALTVNGLVGATTVRFDGDVGANGGNYTFNIKDATSPATADAITLDMRGGALTATSSVTFDGVETATISTANATAAKAFNIVDPALVSLTVNGLQSVDLSGAALGPNVNSVNASGLSNSAGLTVALNQTAGTGANVTGSAGVDSIVGSNRVDVINGGAGADLLTGSTGADTLTGGAGADQFRYGAKATVIAADGSNVDKVTDFTAGTDKIVLLTTANTNAGDILAGVNFNQATDAVAPIGATLTNTTSVASIADVYTGLGASLSAASFLASAADGTATRAQLVTFTTGAAAGTYLVINDATAGFQAADDLVINVTGLTGTLQSSDFQFV